MAELRASTFWRDVSTEFLATFFLASSQTALQLHFYQDSEAECVSQNVLTVAIGYGLVTILVHHIFSSVHTNPALSLYLVFLKATTPVKAIVYVIVQSVAAITGTTFIYGITTSSNRDRLSPPQMAQDTKEWQAFFWESWVSCLILLAFRKPWDSTTHQTNTTSTERDTEKQKEINDCVIIGGGMTLAILVTSGSSGGFLNPVLALGPAVLSGEWTDHWIYWLGPILGAVLAWLVDRGLGLFHMLSQLLEPCTCSCQQSHLTVAAQPPVRTTEDQGSRHSDSSHRREPTPIRSNQNSHRRVPTPITDQSATII